MKIQQDLPTGERKKTMVRSMFDDIAPTYEKTNSFISFGLDKYARRIALKELRMPPGSIVVDLACGTGDFSRMLNAHNMVPVACDLSFGMLNHAHATQDRIQFDATVLPLPSNSCDGVVCGYAMRNFVELGTVFEEIMRVLKSGGRFVAVDVSVPKNRLLKLGNRIWFAKIAPKVGWLISKNKDAYEYLPRSTAYLPSEKALSDMMIKAGAQNVHITPLLGGSLILISATKAPRDKDAIGF